MKKNLFIGIYFLFCIITGCTEKKNPIVFDRLKSFPEIKRGMLIGEVGAGSGRFTFSLAEKIGDSGIIYANDIDINELEKIKKKCKEENIKNIKTVFGQEKDPCFPSRNLDMVFILATFHHLKYQEVMLKNILYYLKNSGLLIINEMSLPNDTNEYKYKEYTDITELIEICEKNGYKLVSIKPYNDISYVYVFSIKKK